MLFGLFYFCFGKRVKIINENKNGIQWLKSRIKINKYIKQHTKIETKN